MCYGREEIRPNHPYTFFKGYALSSLRQDIVVQQNKYTWEKQGRPKMTAIRVIITFPKLMESLIKIHK